jgi:hypothetical protein
MDYVSTGSLALHDLHLQWLRAKVLGIVPSGSFGFTGCCSHLIRALGEFSTKLSTILSGASVIKVRSRLLGFSSNGYCGCAS